MGGAYISLHYSRLLGRITAPRRSNKIVSVVFSAAAAYTPCLYGWGYFTLPKSPSAVQSPITLDLYTDAEPWISLVTDCNLYPPVKHVTNLL